MKVYTNFSHPTEICDVAKLFFADAVYVEEPPFDIKLTEHVEGTLFTYIATFFARVEMQHVDIEGLDELQATRLKKRFAKLALYNLLSKVTNKRMPWGSLTGIRPTKLACQLTAEGLDWQNQFTQVLGVSQQKTHLVKSILETQGQLRAKRDNVADMYIGIPFCVSRCSYCSFTSGEIERLKQYVAPYVEALKDDIGQTIDFAKNNGISIRNVYFGGGTPTSLSAKQLDEIMQCIDFSPLEYTVEAGRPDTIDEDKLKVLKKHGVHRISINPQTFNQSVLDVIGRKHTVQDIYDKYNLAKQFGFDINMDLIAGLPEETYEMFCHSIDSAIALQPENITVHTLALKHGAALKLQNYSSADKDVSAMVEYSHQALGRAGYVPYYMYRQKYVMENLENVGFCKPGKPCLYNIGIMEEVSDILACGTNGISKKLFSDQNRIERAANAKDVITYIQRTQDYIDKKLQLFSVKK